MVDLHPDAPSCAAATSGAVRGGDRQRGFVLPVVLVMLLLMTIVVLFLMRRSSVDERIAFNVRQVTALDTAAQFALRTCERLLWVSPPGVSPEPGQPAPPAVVTAPPATATAAWRVNANWTGNQVSLGGTPAEITGLFGAGVSAARCLYENAQDELLIYNDAPSGTANALLPADAWRKYRITAEVIGTNGSAGRAQTEVRLAIP